ncbi:MAG: hypothetical protein ACI857_003386 [Arenicella sp.]|jgi:hypothetical protein
MSKRKLKQYLEGLTKKELELQVLELHDRLKEVKDFYGFVFNPKEDKMLDEAKFRISKEYFPPGTRKPKKRRSVAQKKIKEFIKLGVEPGVIAELMLYNIEVAAVFNSKNPSNQDSFYRSMLKSFQEATTYMKGNSLQSTFSERVLEIVEQSFKQNWINRSAFEDTMDSWP